MGFIWLTQNLHRGFYVAHPKPSPWVLYSSPKTFIMGFIWFTQNQHRGFYMDHPKPSPWVLRNPFREIKGFNICLITPVNQSIRVLCGLPTSTNFKKTQASNLFTVRNYQHHIQLDKHRPYSLDLLR